MDKEYIIAVLGLIALIIAAALICIFIARTKGKKTAVLKGLLLADILAFIGVCGFLAFPKPIIVKLPDGSEKSVSAEIKNEYVYAVQSQDIEKIKKILNENSVLVYYSDNGGRGLIEQAALMGNIDMMTCAYSYGARFDSSNDGKGPSLEHYLYTLIENRNYNLKNCNYDNIYSVVGKMIEYGAVLSFDDVRSPNALFPAAMLIGSDKVIDDKDVDLIQLLIDNGCSVQVKNSSGETALDILRREKITAKTAYTAERRLNKMIYGSEE